MDGSTGHQNGPGRKHRHRVANLMAGPAKVRAWRELTRRWVVDLRARVTPAVTSLVRAADDQDPPVGEESGGVLDARCGHLARRLELSRGRIKDLGRAQNLTFDVVSAGHQHATISQGGG